MQGYIKAKSHIFDNQGGGDFAIIGVDDANSQKLYEELRAVGKIGHIIPISTKRELSGGILVKEGVIYDNTDISLPRKYHLGNLERLPGAHNGQNIAAAFATSLSLGIAAEDIISAIKSFAGLRHRIQLAAQINGIKFINDSKATNAEASANALRAYDQIYWIAGGLAKEGGIGSLAEFFPRIRHAFLIGKAQDDFAKALDGKVPYTKCETLAKAFDASAKQALHDDVKGAVVLLSPACASWDQWPNFEVRGDAFCDMSEKLADQINSHKTK
jgi:UDP-N-acetylmuramoylalanine--D-glutamate ligase